MATGCLAHRKHVAEAHKTTPPASTAPRCRLMTPSSVSKTPAGFEGPRGTLPRRYWNDGARFSNSSNPVL